MTVTMTKFSKKLLVTILLAGLAALLAPPPAQAAPAFQSGCTANNIQSSGTSVTISGLTCTTGWLLLVQCASVDARTYTITDSTGGTNTWVNDDTQQFSGNIQNVFRSVIGGSTTSVTCGISGAAAFIDMSVTAYSNAAGFVAPPLDQVNSTQSASGTLTITANNPNVQAEEINFIALCSTGVINSSAPTAGYTKRQGYDAGSCETWDKFTSGIETPTFTVTTNAVNIAIQLATYKTSAGPAGPTSIKKGVSY